MREKEREEELTNRIYLVTLFECYVPFCIRSEYTVTVDLFEFLYNSIMIILQG